MAFPIRDRHRKNERIGRLRDQIQIVSQTTYVDAIGAEVQTWATGDVIWANVDYQKTGSEDTFLADRITNELSALVTMRYDSSIEPENKMIFDGQHFEVLSILPDSHKMYMQLETVAYSGTSATSGSGTLPFSTGFYREEFASPTATLTVTANGGVLPSDTDRITVYWDNGQIVSKNYWSVSGSDIALTFTPSDVSAESIWIDFSYNAG